MSQSLRVGLTKPQLAMQGFTHRESVDATVGSSGLSAHAAVRTNTAVSRAMRQDVTLLDMGRPARVKKPAEGQDVLLSDVLLHEEVYMS